MSVHIQPHNIIHQFSSDNTPRVAPPGIPNKALRAPASIDLNLISWMGKSFDCDPRQLGLMLSHGNHPHADALRAARG